jgi:hypothetical protein
MVLVQYLRTMLASLHTDERAQDAFEYLLVIGGVSVAVILAVATPVGGTLIDAVVVGVCEAIDAIPVGSSTTFGLDCDAITA